MKRTAGRHLIVCPKRHSTRPTARAPEVVRLVIQTRQRREKGTVGLVSARALQQELLRRRLPTTVPSQTTIKRWLRQAGMLGAAAAAVAPAYYPALPPQTSAVTFSGDWVARYLTGGEKVFVFHTLDLETRALAQSRRADKRTARDLRPFAARRRGDRLPRFFTARQRCRLYRAWSSRSAVRPIRTDGFVSGP